MNSFLRYISIVLLCAGTTGVQARAKRNIQWPTMSYHANQEGMVVDARVLGKQEANDLFDNRGYKLLGRKPIIPIEISITNSSETPRIIKTIATPFALIDQQLIADRLHRQSYTKVVLWALAGGLAGIVGGAVFGSMGVFALTTGLYGYIGMEVLPVILVGGFAGAFTGYPIGSYLLARSEYDAQLFNNKAIKKQLVCKMVDTEIVIKPGRTYSGYLFTKDYDALMKDFSISVA